MISIKGRFCIFEEADKDRTTPKPAGQDKAQEIVDQFCRDAQDGTFGKLPKYFEDKWERNLQDRGEVIADNKSDGTYTFTVNIDDELIPVKVSGLQHLCGILASDVFRLPAANSSPGNEIHIESVGLSPELKKECLDTFRKNANGVNAVRIAFNLQKGEPLLAFSFKPRFGLKFDAIKDITEGVFDAGFHIVEMDTRHVIQPDSFERYLGLTVLAAQKSSHNKVRRFSMNLSMPAHLLLEYLPRIYGTDAPEPFVFKVDGGFDGFGALQAIRSNEDYAKKTIITCYPLLRNELKNLIPPGFFNEVLYLSGADIIYPGGRPEISSKQVMEGAKRDSFHTAVKRYQKIIANYDWTPTMAGGIEAAHLHAFYHFLGPETPYFLGGPISLHKKGPVQGAKLCKNIFEEAAQIREKWNEGEPIPDLPDALISELKEAYGKEYFPPEELRIR